jgi:hypothetical protein
MQTLAGKLKGRRDGEPFDDASKLSPLSKLVFVSLNLMAPTGTVFKVQ